MENNQLDQIRKMIDSGFNNAQILAVLAFAAGTTVEPSETRTSARSMAAKSGKRAVSRSTFVKPDTTRTAYRLTALGRKRYAAEKISGNMGEIAAYLSERRDNEWTDTRLMRSAGVLAHGEKKSADGSTKNKALESAIHGMKVDGLLTLKAKPATMPNGVELDD